MRRAGICGSDIHYFTHGRAGSFVLRHPFILGHEIAGEVADIGPSVKPDLRGERVAVDPSMPCGNCAFCREGRYNLCTSMRFYGSASTNPHVNGGFAEYVIAPAVNCHVLPGGVGWAEAAMTEPLSVAVHAVMRSGSVAGKSVLVTGGGAIGQLTALVARAFGASKIVLSDIAAFPRELAVELGADGNLDAVDPSALERGLDAMPGGFHIVFEASGAPAAVPLAIGLARRGATIVQIGTLPPEVSAPLNTIMARELSYVGSFRFANAFAIALDLMASHRVDVTRLVSAVLPFEQMAAAMDRAVGKDGVIKVQVES
ncbi:MAG TPA: L-idonate 5-dehydrogenase [Rhizobiaceae bacterium]|nr:L-idonate 5-dehydrogenase [Rhizobiaceae bacterium]